MFVGPGEWVCTGFAESLNAWILNVVFHVFFLKRPAMLPTGNC